MSRLATRLALAMLLVAVLSAAVIVVSQQVGRELHLRTLPGDVQQRILQDREAREARQDDLAGGILSVREYQTRATYVGVGIAAMVAVTIATLLARTISKPIERVSEASTDLARGNLAARAPSHGRFSSLEAQTLTREEVQ